MPGSAPWMAPARVDCSGQSYTGPISKRMPAPTTKNTSAATTAPTDRAAWLM